MRSLLLSQSLRAGSSSEIPRAWQWFKNHQKLALVYGNQSEQEYSTILTFLFLDVRSFTIDVSASLLDSREAIETLRVVHVPSAGYWLIGSLANFVRVHRFVYDKAKLEMTTHVLFEDAGDGQAPLGPIYTLGKREEQCAVIYRRPEADFMGDTLIYLSRGKIFGDSLEQTVLGEGDAALVCAHAETTLLLTLNPRKGETTWGWGLRLSCYTSSSFARLWQRELGLFFPDAPTPPLTGENDLEWLGINATILPGQFSPGSTQQSWIVGATMVDIFQISGRGHSSLEASLVRKQASLLAWLDDTGQELWRCSDALGLRLQFCQIGVVVVGVDLYEGRWRLWTWHPHQHLALQHIVPLDQGLLRAHVLREENGESQQFWLLEEFENGIKVSHYATAFFQEVPSTTWLSNRHLLKPQIGVGLLNWHEERDAWVDGNTLFFLCLDEKQQLSLYQVE
jgi:hypothetical protein